MEQLISVLNGAESEYTVTGRVTDTSQIMGTAIVTTTMISSVLTITPLAGGTHPVSAHLVIMQIG